MSHCLWSLCSPVHTSIIHILPAFRALLRVQAVVKAPEDDNIDEEGMEVRVFTHK